MNKCPYFNLQPTAEKFTVEQIELCKKCLWISGKKIWCCHWGVWVRENKIVMPPIGTQAKNFTKAVGKRIKNRKNRTGKELERVREICKSCEAYYEKGILPRCKHCGCCTALKTKWESEDCPLGKWNLK